MYEYQYIYTYMYAVVILEKIMNLKESKKGYIGVIGRKKEGRKIL